MKTFNRILMGMDLSNTDLYLLDYLRVFAGIHKPEKIYCAHVVQRLDLPSFILNELGNMDIKPLDERLKKNLEDEVNLKIRPGEMDINCDVLEGNVGEKLLHWSDVKATDLAILGRKIPVSGTGVAAKRFLRRSNSSVLFVPHKKKERIKTIVVATDFSKTSTYVLQNVVAWAKQLPGQIKLKLVHVYDVPSGINAQLGTLPATIKQRIRETTEEFCEEYLKELKLQEEDITFMLVENNHVNPGHLIYEAAKDLKADLLVMGAQGHSFLGNLILGSVSEKVLDLNLNIPLLILRPKEVELNKLDSFSIKTFKTIEYA